MHSLYYECVGGARPSAGIFEWDTESKQLVELFANASGSMAALPFEDYVVAVNKGNNRASVFYPQGNMTFFTLQAHMI
jgi:Na+/H+ antiporter NhaB